MFLHGEIPALLILALERSGLSWIGRLNEANAVDSQSLDDGQAQEEHRKTSEREKGPHCP